MILVDASVWVGRFLPQDAHHGACKAWLANYLAGGETVVVPAHAFAEIAGAISRRTGDEALGRRAVELILKVPSLKVVNVGRDLGLEGATVASHCKLRGADALYVAAARTLNIPLATLDKEQEERGGQCANVFSPGEFRNAQ